MRAVFYVDLPSDANGNYLENDKLVETLRKFGWEPEEIRRLTTEEDKLKRYQQMAAGLFASMPEIRASTEKNVIFYGIVSSEQTEFMVTRSVAGQITFRLLQPDLSQLLTATERLIRQINSIRTDGSLKVSNQKIVVYEREHENLILKGRFIPNVLRETLRTDRKDTLLTLVPLALVIPLMLGLVVFDPANSLVSGTMERASTALLTTSIVSFLGLVQTYWAIRQQRMIDWTFTSGETIEGN